MIWLHKKDKKMMICKLTFVLLGAGLMAIAACKDDKRYLSREEMPGYVMKDSTNVVEQIKAWQAEMNKEFKDPETSPLTEVDRKTFKGLSFFTIDTAYRVTARLELTPYEPSFLMKTTTSRSPEYKRYGILYFKIKGKEYQLNVYQSQELKLQEGYEDYLFIPFTDDTNGMETYGGGRYMDARIPKGETMVLDFNQAYNPYCAYNKRYSCPVVPSENKLSLAIKAGIKKFKDH